MPRNKDNVVSFDEAAGARSRREAGERSTSRPAAFEPLDGAYASRRRSLVDFPGQEEEGAVSDAASEGFAPRSALFTADAHDDAASKRRKKMKEKAGRLFDRQFGGDETQASSGPRAAVYRGEAGRVQRRAMGELKAASPASASPGAALRAARRVETKERGVPALLVLAVVVGVLAFAGFFLYSPAKSLYTQIRDEQRAEAEYLAVVERNDAMSAEIEALKTDEGVADEARSQLGWVNEGEEAVIVEGLDAPSSPDANDTVHSVIVSSEVKAPETWYSPLLDQVFGYAYGPDSPGSGTPAPADESSDAAASGKASASGSEGRG